MSAASTWLASVAASFLCWRLAIRRLRRVPPDAHGWTGTLPVLGGSVPPTHAWSRFHLRYYPMVILFIAFEMEMMFMYPWAVVFVREGGKALAEMGMFLALLGVGIAYLWREGGLRWQ